MERSTIDAVIDPGRRPPAGLRALIPIYIRLVTIGCNLCVLLPRACLAVSSSASLAAFLGTSVGLRDVSSRELRLRTELRFASMRSGLRPGRTYERQRCRVGAARLRCRAGTASPPSSSSSSAPSKPAKTGKSRLGAVLPVRPLTLKDVFLSTEMRRVPAVNSANSAQQALTLLGSAVSLATPLSALSYPYMINLVADLLHDNPPNTQVLSYYLSTGE